MTISDHANTPLQTLVFVVLQVLLLPLAIVGALAMGWKELRGSKKHRVSYTAGQAIQGRWVMHYFGTRPEETMARFIKVLPVESHWGFMCFMSAALVANRTCGYVPNLARIPTDPADAGITSFLNYRTSQFDRIMTEAIERVDQVVVMGAGFDTRVLDLAHGKDVTVFELDMENTQRMKIETLDLAGIERGWVRYLSIDFRNESWADRLVGAGFDPSRTTYWHWETVNLYLAEAIVRDTMRGMAELSASGSIIGLDLYEQAFTRGETSWAIKRGLAVIERFDEPWLFGIDISGGERPVVEALLADCGWSLKELIPCGQASSLGKGRPFYFVVEAEKPGPA